MTQDDYGAIKASSCVCSQSAILCEDKIFRRRDLRSDTFQEMLCRRLHQSRPDTDKAPGLSAVPGQRHDSQTPQRKYPQAARAMSIEAAVYNSQLRQAKELEAEGRLLIIAGDIGKMKTLTKDH